MMKKKMKALVSFEMVKVLRSWGEKIIYHENAHLLLVIFFGMSYVMLIILSNRMFN